MSVSPPIDENVLGDRELVSLYMKYPELSLIFDDDEKLPQDAEQSSDLLSSPVTSLTWLSGSTTRTTPMRPDALVLITGPPNDYHELLRILRESGLPTPTCVHFTSLANRMRQIGSLLFRPHLAVSPQESVDEVWHHCSEIKMALELACQKIQDQIANVNYILTLAPFTIKTKKEDLLCNYRQKAELIIKYAQFPSKAELNVLKSLARIFDAYVYNSALLASRTLGFDEAVLGNLNDLYDLLMTLLGRYKQWCRAKADLKNSHMSPVVSRILASAEVCQTIKETEVLRDTAEQSARDPNKSEVQPLEDKVLAALRVSARRKALLTGRVKTRFRREHTL